MEALLATAIGILTACGIFLMLRPRTFSLVLGLTLRFPLKYPLSINKLSVKNGMHDADIAPISVTKR